VAVWLYHRKQLIHWRSAVELALGLLVGAVVGAQIAVSIQPQLFVALVRGVSVLHWMATGRTASAAGATPNAHGTRVTNDPTPPTPNPLLIACLGLFAGVSLGCLGLVAAR
jgi:uncharacterized membrane protein YfcA